MMMEEEGHEIAHHLSIKIERKKYVQKLYTNRPKKLYVKRKKLYAKRKMYVKIKKLCPVEASLD